MTQKEFRVGIVGADTKASWAKVSHVPAINGLPGLKLAAVATRNEQSARQAAEAFGADRWFSDPFAMIGDDLIDVITIAVKVPAHRELVLAVLDAGCFACRTSCDHSERPGTDALCLSQWCADRALDRQHRQVRASHADRCIHDPSEKRETHFQHI